MNLCTVSAVLFIHILIETIKGRISRLTQWDSPRHAQPQACSKDSYKRSPIQNIDLLKIWDYSCKASVTWLYVNFIDDNVMSQCQRVDSRTSSHGFSLWHGEHKPRRSHTFWDYNRVGRSPAGAVAQACSLLWKAGIAGKNSDVSGIPLLLCNRRVLPSAPSSHADIALFLRDLARVSWAGWVMSYSWVHSDWCQQPDF